jgi:nitrogen fixation NifU-like protein
MTKYPKILMEHFQNPRNVGEISDPDGVGTVGNASCGDIMQLFIKTNGDKILTERIIGATLDEALKISEETSKEVLSQLPKEKIPCFTLATDALKLAIEEYRCKQSGVHEKGGFDMSKMEKD